ncbi:hypothetical protein Kisp01_07970 [Kineosporia sp. NBRC 101677]|uniref:DUF1800 domain-containing protein n=1 Tax=Kineosporia sp. NBRC 101677 TaxID=3032197 RepID=UPI0024A1A028|nr:DUF1800 domain-containing protein [Kineosporia sp. NBRC 101677]GLY13781.1 hypothetical protein Kisp01_07970 [Kineosporia sp. NBRC 101677]
MDAQTLLLLRRATYGPTPALLAEAQKMGRKAWLDRQLTPAQIPDSYVEGILGRFPRVKWPIAKIRQEYAKNFGSWDVMLELTRATMVRAIWSERQLFELMVEFWSNHLNVTCPSGDVWDSRADYDRVIREHTFGRFGDLLVAASLHPAMQSYLDNASSTKDHPNENQGRELLELHTVGVGTGYTEDDVKDSARILTGFGTDGSGEATYRPKRHFVGPVGVLGFSDPNPTAEGGQELAVRYLNYLARHENTARQLAYKLCLRFVADNPPAALVTRLAETYLANDTAIVPVLRELFGSREFATSSGQKLRRPYEDLVATMRILGMKPDAKGTEGIESLHWMILDMGHCPLYWGPPNGYPDVASAWQSPAGTLARWNSHLNIAARFWPKTLVGPNLSAMIPNPRPATHGALINALSERLLQRKATQVQQVAICDFLSDEWHRITPASPVKKDSVIIGWRLPYVVSLLLDSPAHALR